MAVPEKVARILTYPERVTAHNREQLAMAVRLGTECHPGANLYIPRSDSKTVPQKKSLKVLRQDARDQIADKLKIGDVVERHLRDGE